LRIATLSRAAVASLACGIAAHAAAQTDSIAYYAADRSFTLSYVIDWNEGAHTAHILETFGVADGSYAEDGAQRIITLAQPLRSTGYKYDCNGDLITLDDQLLQLVFRTATGGPRKGTTQLVPIGTVTDVGGCTPGLVTPYGSVTDAGLPMHRIDMALRPSMADIVPGARIAGFSEDVLDMPGDEAVLAAQFASFSAGSLRFEGSGHSWPTSATSDGWLVVDYGGFQRAYTRIASDGMTGGETWFAKELKDGVATSLEMPWMAKPNAAAGFGGAKAAARDWQSGIFRHSFEPTWFDLYRDGTGVRDIEPADGSPPSLRPLAWHLDGADIVIERDLGAGAGVRRTWVPVSNTGKYHFVLESEDFLQDGVFQYTDVPARVNYVEDDGRSVEPAVLTHAAAAAKARAPAPSHRSAN
jgi:hypothetical protein